ncbi:MAG: hypothetical protein K6G37_01350 [Bacilli bacterium]|nr:hypothetical protein [Bacilli bacterium]
MENEKRKMHPFFKLLIILFIIFIAFYISLESGYYPSRVQKRTITVNNEMVSFETDLSKHKKINKQGYVKKDIDYSNFVTKTANALTYSLGKAIEEGTKGIGKTFKILFG